MLWPVKYLCRLIAVACLCSCRADRSVPSGASSTGAPVTPFAHSTRTHPQGSIVATLRDGRRPFGIALSRTGIVYGTLLDAARLVRSTFQAESLATVLVGAVPTDVAFSPAGTWAYVTNQGSQTVGVVDARTSRLVDQVGVNGDPYRVAVGPEGQVIYVTTNTGNLELIDPAVRSVTRTVQLGGNLNGLAINVAGSRVYVGDVGGTIYEIDAAGDVIRSFDVPGRPQGLGLSADGRELYAAGEDGYFIVLNLETGAEVARLALGAGGFGLAVTPDQTQVWITAPSAGKVFVVNRTTRVLRSTIELGGKPRRLAFDQSGALAVIADEAGAIRFVQ